MPGEVSVLLGESIQLVCSANGVPTPAMQWLKDGKRIASDDVERIRRAKISILFLYNFKPQRALRREWEEGLRLSLDRLRTSPPSLASINQVYFVTTSLWFFFFLT